MKITIISVGKIKEKYLREGIVEYSKRLRPYCSLEIVEVDDEQAPENLSEAQMLIVKEKEAEKIRKKIREGTVVIALDIRGARLSSEGFASKIENYLNAGKSHITFLIGGSLGLDDNLLRQAEIINNVKEKLRELI